VDERQRVVVTGATGLIGRALLERLADREVDVVALSRDPARARQTLGDEIEHGTWDFDRPEVGDWREHIAAADAVVHLAGTPLFSQRWTRAFKRQMEHSRTHGTRQLAEAVLEAERGPRVFVSASAVGIYGTDPDRVVDEGAAPGDDLLARICVRWEAETERLRPSGVRVVLLRVGIVLSTESGALAEMLPLFRAGLGGVLGRPDPWVNWIHLRDTAALFEWALVDEQVRGVFNAVAPDPVTNEVFTRTLARVLRRPAWMRYPIALIRAVIGEAGEYASGGARVSAGRVLGAGFEFEFAELEEALRDELGR